MSQFSLKTQINIIMATFVLHNYIRRNSEDDSMFIILEQHLDYIPQDELQDIRGSVTSNKTSRMTSKEIKEIHDNINALLWNAR